MIRFIVLSTYRSGTVFLRTMLNAHPRVSCLSEIYSEAYEFWDFDAERSDPEMFAKSNALRIRDPANFIERYCFRVQDDRWDAAGFTLMYDQPIPPPQRDTLWDFLVADRDIRVVHLRRSNELLRYVSLCRADMTGQWVNLTEPGLAPVSVPVDPDNFLANVSDTEQLRDQALQRLGGHGLLSLTYEDLAADPSRQLSRVFEFLGVEPIAAQPSTFRQGTSDLRVAISNYDELRRRIAGTTAEKWLDPEPEINDRQHPPKQSVITMSDSEVKPVLDFSSCPLRDVVREAWGRRDKFDLRGVGYGRIHWGNLTDVLDDPFAYYFFLAGMVNLTGSRHIVEIGTHHGGSAKALAAGLQNPAASRIVTFDVTTDGATLLAGNPVIRAYSLDANSEPAFDACVREFGAPLVDLVYIDSTHGFWPTLLSFLIYGIGLRPAFVILDDITLNPEMERLWDLLKTQFGENCIDATDVVEQIRMPASHRPGFGVVRTNGPSPMGLGRRLPIMGLS